MSQTPQEHRKEAPQVARCAVVTVSDTRTAETDIGGQTIIELLTAAGHTITERTIIPDEPAEMRSLLADHAGRDDVDAVFLTGGTGISRRDQTYETLSVLLTKVLPGYGELFRTLSYEEIGPSAMLSRAIGEIGRAHV